MESSCGTVNLFCFVLNMEWLATMFHSLVGVAGGDDRAHRPRHSHVVIEIQYS
jgi:hypothetical protein